MIFRRSLRLDADDCRQASDVIRGKTTLEAVRIPVSV
jgi:hypothetical protein